MANKSLGTAKKEKNDEFYTQLSDVEKELSNYTDQLRGKVIFCNCDDPYESNFFKYFAMNFNNLGLKKLKHIRVGNECRVIRLSVSFFIPSLIFIFHCQFAVSLSFFRLCITFCRLPQWGISEHFTFNQAQTLIEALHLI